MQGGDASFPYLPYLPKRHLSAIAISSTVMQHDADEDARPRDAQQKEINITQRVTQHAASPDLYTNATPAHLYRFTVSTATPTSDADAASPA